MEELKRPTHAPEKKQVVVNIGKLSTHSGGGIGSVILLGGALATAAFASAFIIGRKRRGGSRGDGRPNTHIPPSDERDIEPNNDCSTLLDANKQSSETTENFQLKNDDQSLVLYEKHRIEINGVAVCDSETREQILCSLTPTRTENSAISNGGVSHLPAQEQKCLSNTAVHDAKIQPSIDENGTRKERNDFEEVEAGGGGGDDREIELMGEIQTSKPGLKFSEEGTLVLEHGKDGQESKLPVVGSPTSKHENANGDERQDIMSGVVPEIIHDRISIQQGGADQLEHVQEHLVQEREKCNEPDEEIVPLKGEEEKEDAQCEENIEEQGYIDHSKPENKQLGVSGKEDLQILAMHLPEDERISAEEMEVAEYDAVDREIETPLCQQKDTEDEVQKNVENEVEDSSETIDSGIATGEDEQDITDGTSGDEDLSDEAEQNTEGSVAIQEPSIETQQEKLVSQEIQGKIQEDKTVKPGKHEPHQKKIQTMNGRSNSAKTFIDRYVVDLATLKSYSTNSGTRKALLLAIPVLSSVSCSWFFGLSFDKFCFVVLFTIILSKSVIVK